MNRIRGAILLIFGIIAVVQGFRVHTNMHVPLLALGFMAILYGLWRLFSKYGQMR